MKPKSYAMKKTKKMRVPGQARARARQRLHRKSCVNQLEKYVTELSEGGVPIAVAYSLPNSAIVSMGTSKVCKAIRQRMASVDVSQGSIGETVENVKLSMIPKVHDVAEMGKIPLRQVCSNLVMMTQGHARVNYKQPPPEWWPQEVEFSEIQGRKTVQALRCIAQAGIQHFRAQTGLEMESPPDENKQKLQLARRRAFGKYTFSGEGTNKMPKLSQRQRICIANVEKYVKKLRSCGTSAAMVYYLPTGPMQTAGSPGMCQAIVEALDEGLNWDEEHDTLSPSVDAFIDNVLSAVPDESDVAELKKIPLRQLCTDLVQTAQTEQLGAKFPSGRVDYNLPPPPWWPEDLEFGKIQGTKTVPELKEIAKAGISYYKDKMQSKASESADDQSGTKSVPNRKEKKHDKDDEENEYMETEDFEEENTMDEGNMEKEDVEEEHMWEDIEEEDDPPELESAYLEQVYSIPEMEEGDHSYIKVSDIQKQRAYFSPNPNIKKHTASHKPRRNAPINAFTMENETLIPVMTELGEIRYIESNEILAGHKEKTQQRSRKRQHCDAIPKVIRTAHMRGPNSARLGDNLYSSVPRLGHYTGTSVPRGGQHITSRLDQDEYDTDPRVVRQRQHPPSRLTNHRQSRMDRSIYDVGSRMPRLPVDQDFDSSIAYIARPCADGTLTIVGTQVVPSEVPSPSKVGRRFQYVGRMMASSGRVDASKIGIPSRLEVFPTHAKSAVKPKTGGKMFSRFSSYTKKKNLQTVKSEPPQDVRLELKTVLPDPANQAVDYLSEIVINMAETHPSVCIKGTENNYEPKECVDPICSNTIYHMHCPFCVSTDSYLDPTTLQDHYRLQHIEKSIDFAGLKVLRCCDHCDIEDNIKGVKDLKGTHWHCYKCKNAFNRRNEAVKHYRTHFRNPQSTQETHQLLTETEIATETIATQEENFTISSVHPTLAEAALTASTEATDTLLDTQPVEASMANGRSESGEVHVSVAANETVDTSEGQTIMIIQEDQIPEGGFSAGTLQLASGEGIQIGDWLEQKAQLMRQVAQLQQKYQHLEAENMKKEASYKQQIGHLKAQVKMKTQELTSAQKREQDLIRQLSIPISSRTQELLTQLRENHEDLLQQQLAYLSQTYSHEAEPIIVMQDGSTAGSQARTVPLSHVQADASGTFHIVMTPEMSSEGSTLTSDGKVATKTAKMYPTQTASNLVTATDITIVTDSAYSNSTHAETISLPGGKATSILIDAGLPNTITSNSQKANIKLQTDKPPPTKRKK